MSKTHVYANQCGLCDQERVGTVGAIRLCQRHLDLVNAIVADAKKAKVERRKKAKAAA